MTERHNASPQRATATHKGTLLSGGVDSRYPDPGLAVYGDVWVDPETGLGHMYYVAVLVNTFNQWITATDPAEVDAPIARAALDSWTRATLYRADNALLNLEEAGNWAPSTAYDRGDVVTSQYARWYCHTPHTSLAAWAETNWIHLGLNAVGATSDPGGGRLWVNVS